MDQTGDDRTIGIALEGWRAARSRYGPDLYLREPPDALLLRVGERRVLLTALHATPATRDGAIRAAEADSGAMAEGLCKAFGYSCLTSVGPQSGDANRDDGHPARDLISERLADAWLVLDLHMMRDTHGPEVCIGMGPEPDAAAGRLAALAAHDAVAAGLECSINWPFPARPGTVTALVQASSGTALQIETAIRMQDPVQNPEAAARLLRWWLALDRRIQALESRLAVDVFSGSRQG